MPILQLRPHQQDAVDSMSDNTRGIICMPTGSGKTITMVKDAQRVFDTNDDATIVVVGPTIALTTQLCNEFMTWFDDVAVCHVHSGHVPYYRTTDPTNISLWVRGSIGPKFIFTSYHSLHRIQESGIRVDTIYFDESHNSINRQWFDSVKYFSQTARRTYYMTASPKVSVTPDKHGMNETEVYGDIICDVPVTQMIYDGYIVPPNLITIKSDTVADGKYPAEVDINNLIKSITSNELNTVLVSCKNTTQLYHVSTSERFTTFCTDNDYTIYTISSKYGCIINGDKVPRNDFMTHMKNNTGRYVVFHVSILCEGINLPKLEGLVLLKKLNTIKLVQSIGRVLRLDEGKTEGKVVLPAYSKYLQKSEKFTVNLVTRVYEDGQTPIEFIRR